MFSGSSRVDAIANLVDSQRATDCLISGMPLVDGYTANLSRFSANACTTNAGEVCLGSPIDNAICGKCAGGVIPAFNAVNFSNG